MISRSVKFLILIHMCISLGGMLIHIKIHPVGKSLYFWWASPLNVTSLVVLPILFARSSTIAWGYLLNAFTVAIGTIGMSYFSFLNLERPLTLYRIMIESTLPDILILWAKLPLASLILHEMRPKVVPQRETECAQ